MLDKNPFTITEFKGLDRGSVDNVYSTPNNSQVSFSYALDGRNLRFTKEGGLRTRGGVGIRAAIDNNLTSEVVTMFWKINRLGTTDYTNRWLYLVYKPSSNEGKFFDTGAVSPTSALLTLTGCKFASVINIFGKVYISPLSDFGIPLANAKVYVYDGTTARVTGGNAPTGATLAVADTAIAGANMTQGLHFAAIAFETASGFITKPGPATWIQVTISTATGHGARFTNIDTGPSGTVARHLLMSKVVLNYDGIQSNIELFFALRIADNTTTTGDVTVPDTGLVNSADKLMNEYTSIPACSAISVLKGRMIYNGINTDQRVALVAKVADPETIDQTEDYIQIFDGIPNEIFNSKELRGTLYIFKETSTFVTADNGGPPNTWEVNLVDSGMGASPMGIGEVLANPGGLVLDHLIIVNLSGVYLFSGTFQQMPLSRALQAVFESDLKRSHSRYSRIAVDPIKRALWLLVGKPALKTDDYATTDLRLYHGDYFNGLDPNAIKWLQWDLYVRPYEPPV